MSKAEIDKNNHAERIDRQTIRPTFGVVTLIASCVLVVDRTRLLGVQEKPNSMNKPLSDQLHARWVKVVASSKLAKAISNQQTCPLSTRRCTPECESSAGS